MFRVESKPVERVPGCPLSQKPRLKYQPPPKTTWQRFDELEIQKMNEALQDFGAGCLALSAARARAATALSKALVASLSELGMTRAQFRTDLDTAENPEGPVERDGRRYTAAEHGMEQVAFHISANAGEAPRPLQRAGSALDDALDEALPEYSSARRRRGSSSSFRSQKPAKIYT